MIEHFVHKFVRPEDVEQEGRAGWVLVAVHQSTVVLTPGDHKYDHRSNTSTYVPTTHGPGLLVQLRRDVESPIDMLEAKLLKLNAECQALHGAKYKLECEITTLKDAAVESQKAHDVSRNRLTAATHNNAELQKSLRRMESDLGTVREAIGSKQMDEILKSGK